MIPRVSQTNNYTNGRIKQNAPEARSARTTPAPPRNIRVVMHGVYRELEAEQGEIPCCVFTLVL